MLCYAWEIMDIRNLAKPCKVNKEVFKRAASENFEFEFRQNSNNKKRSSAAMSSVDGESEMAQKKLSENFKKNIGMLEREEDPS